MLEIFENDDVNSIENVKDFINIKKIRNIEKVKDFVNIKNVRNIWKWWC